MDDSSNPDDMCRICLMRGKLVISVFDFHDSLQYSHKIMHCARIQISELENLPSFICEQCQADLSIAYNFVIKCQNSDDELRRSYQSNYGKLHETHEVSIKFENDIDESEFDKRGLEEEIFSSITIVKEELLQTSKIEISDEKPKDMVTKKIQRKTPINCLKNSNIKRQPDKISKRRGPPPKSDVTCRICGLKTSSISALIGHTRTHTGEKPFICSTCGATFAQKGTLRVHIKRRHTENINPTVKEFACEKCGKLFINKRDMEIHIRIHTGETPYACEYCPRKFSQLSSVIRHRRIHTGERPFSCLICKRTFSDKAVLKCHASVHSEEKQFTCNVCGKSVKKRSTLISHIKLQHKDFKPIICDQCGAVFKVKGNLTAHLKHFHSEKSGVCTVCSKAVPDLASHMRRHTGEAAVSCKVCSKKFSHSRSLTIHMMIHNNADKFKCDEKSCGKKFISKHLLEFHTMKYHSHEVPYRCKLCKKGCLRLCDLKRHMKFYHKSKESV